MVFCRDLPQFGHKHWQTHFGKTFDVYTRVVNIFLTFIPWFPHTFIQYSFSICKLIFTCSYGSFNRNKGKLCF